MNNSNRLKHFFLFFITTEKRDINNALALASYTHSIIFLREDARQKRCSIITSYTSSHIIDCVIPSSSSFTIYYLKHHDEDVRNVLHVLRLLFFLNGSKEEEDNEDEFRSEKKNTVIITPWSTGRSRGGDGCYR